MLSGKIHQFIIEFSHLKGKRGLYLVGITAKHRILNLRIIEADDTLILQLRILTDRGQEVDAVVSQSSLLVCVKQRMLLQ